MELRKEIKSVLPKLMKQTNYKARIVHYIPGEPKELMVSIKLISTFIEHCIWALWLILWRSQRWRESPYFQRAYCIVYQSRFLKMNSFYRILVRRCYIKKVFYGPVNFRSKMLSDWYKGKRIPGHKINTDQGKNEAKSVRQRVWCHWMS